MLPAASSQRDAEGPGEAAQHYAAVCCSELPAASSQRDAERQAGMKQLRTVSDTRGRGDKRPSIQTHCARYFFYDTVVIFAFTTDGRFSVTVLQLRCCWLPRQGVEG